MCVCVCVCDIISHYILLRVSVRQSHRQGEPDAREGIFMEAQTHAVVKMCK